MAQYLNPPELAKQRECLSGRGYAGDYDKYIIAAQGRKIVAYADRLVFKLAPVIEDKSDFDDFYGQYKRGELVSLEFYALDK